MQNFILKFLLKNFVSSLVMHPGHDLHRAVVERFIGFESLSRKKIRWKGTGKTSFNFHGIFQIDAGKNDSAGKPRSCELFLLFTSPGSITHSGRLVM